MPCIEVSVEESAVSVPVTGRNSNAFVVPKPVEEAAAICCAISKNAGSTEGTCERKKGKSKRQRKAGLPLFPFPYGRLASHSTAGQRIDKLDLRLLMPQPNWPARAGFRAQ